MCNQLDLMFRSLATLVARRPVRIRKCTQKLDTRRRNTGNNTHTQRGAIMEYTANMIPYIASDVPLDDRRRPADTKSWEHLHIRKEHYAHPPTPSILPHPDLAPPHRRTYIKHHTWYLLSATNFPRCTLRLIACNAVTSHTMEDPCWSSSPGSHIIGTTSDMYLEVADEKKNCFSFL